MKMRLYLVRHGLTDWNLNRRFQGQTDVPLNETGNRQAAAIGQRLAEIELHSIYASDLRRAWDTAHVIASFHDCPFESDSRLRELNFGDWEGMDFTQIEERYPQAISEWQADTLKYTPPGGENLQHLAGRVGDFMETLLKRHFEQSVLLVAHGGPLQALLCQALNLSLTYYWQFSLSQASLSILQLHSGGATIKLLNDVCHLENPTMQGK